METSREEKVPTQTVFRKQHAKMKERTLRMASWFQFTIVLRFKIERLQERKREIISEQVAVEIAL